MGQSRHWGRVGSSRKFTLLLLKIVSGTRSQKTLPEFVGLKYQYILAWANEVASSGGFPFQIPSLRLFLCSLLAELQHASALGGSIAKLPLGPGVKWGKTPTNSNFFKPEVSAFRR